MTFIQSQAVRRTKGETISSGGKTLKPGLGLTFGNRFIIAKNRTDVTVTRGQIVFLDTYFFTADEAGVAVANYTWRINDTVTHELHPLSNVIHATQANATTGKSPLSYSGSNMAALVWSDSIENDAWGKFMVQGIHPEAHICMGRDDDVEGNFPFDPGYKLTGFYGGNTAAQRSSMTNGAASQKVFGYTLEDATWQGAAQTVQQAKVLFDGIRGLK